MNDKASIISSMATRQILAEVVAAYTQAAGREVDVTSISGVEALKRVRSGERHDLVIVAADGLVQLARDDFVDEGSIRAFAHSPAALAVRAGAAGPAIWDTPSIQRFILQAPRIGVSSGPSGKALLEKLAAWGFGPDEIQRRTALAPPGVPVARLIAAGHADVGVQQWSELMGEPSIDVLGAIPDALLATTVFTLGTCRTGDAARARQLADYLLSEAAAPAKKRYGMT